MVNACNRGLKVVKFSENFFFMYLVKFSKFRVVAPLGEFSDAALLLGNPALFSEAFSSFLEAEDRGGERGVLCILADLERLGDALLDCSEAERRARRSWNSSRGEAFLF